MDFTYSCLVTDSNNITIEVSSVVDDVDATNIFIKLVDGENEIKFATNKCDAKKIADMIRQITKQDDSCNFISSTSPVPKAIPL